MSGVALDGLSLAGQPAFLVLTAVLHLILHGTWCQGHQSSAAGAPRSKYDC